MPDSRAKAKKRAAAKAAGAPAEKPPPAGGSTPPRPSRCMCRVQVYAPALNGPFLFDDSRCLITRPNFSKTLTCLAQRRAAAAHVQLTGSTTKFSQEPNGFHVINFCIHLLNGFLIFFIVRKLLHLRRAARTILLAGFRRRGLPAASHPDRIRLLHRGPVGIAERAVLPGCLRGLPVQALRRRSRGKLPSPCLALFGAAVATKEHTLVLPALLLLTDYYWNPGFSFSGIRRNWRLYVPIAWARRPAWRSSPEFWRAPTAARASA